MSHTVAVGSNRDSPDVLAMALCGLFITKIGGNYMTPAAQIKARIEELREITEPKDFEFTTTASAECPKLLTALERAVEALHNCQNAFGTPDDDDYVTTEAREALSDIANLLKGEK